jgi:thiopurine S-methyltransferase
MDENLDQEFWTQRYKDGDTGWDLGAPSPPIKKFIDELSNKDLKILVPGAGNAYEVEYLWNQGFKNVYVLDISTLPLENFAGRNPDFPKNQMLCMDFFELKEKFDLVIEQTFFCAINPTLRPAYAKKMFEIINYPGKLAGLLFAKEFDKQGPPFGGTAAEYLPYFEPYFRIEKMEICQNSIPPRAGNELWIELAKKQEG